MRIRVATLNAWAFPEPFGHSVVARMRAIGRVLPGLGADVVAFQEVWSPDARRRLLAAGAEAGLPHAWHAGSLALGGGLLVLSRLPIGEARFERYTLPGQPQRPDHPDYYGGKGFALLRIETPAGPIALLDTHLHARYSGDVNHQYRAYRIGEIVQLATGLEDVGLPVVVTGDFNLKETDLEYGILTGLTRLRDVAAESDQREPTVFRGNPYRSRSSKPDRRIDYVLVRDGRGAALRSLGAERVFDEVFEIDGDAESFSDHAGVLAELDLLPGVPGSRPMPDPAAVDSASAELGVGRARAQRRRNRTRRLAGVGFGAAVLAAAALRDPRLTRRRMLRASVECVGIAALAPGLGASLLSEVFAPGELAAFEDLCLRLERTRSELTQPLRR